MLVLKVVVCRRKDRREIPRFACLRRQARNDGVKKDDDTKKHYLATAASFMFSMMAVAKAEVPTLVAPGIIRSRS
jgi:hypothetical protein